MRKRTNVFLGLALVATIILNGCDWEEDGGFNTSKGAGANVNISGMYTARSGELVTGQAITSLFITQIGNSVDVRDSNGSVYVGNVGSPGVMSGPNAAGVYPPGAVLLQSQINFAGKNALTKKDMNFVGIIRAVALADVRGNTVTATTTIDQVRAEATNTLGTTAINIIAPPVTIGDTTTTTGEDSNSTTLQNVQTQTTTYTITDANTLWILEGHWVEAGTVGVVNGAAHSSAGSFSTAPVVAAP